MPANCKAPNCAKELQRLLEGIYDELKVAWPPDGCWLAFDGDLQGRGNGTWLMNMNTKAIFQIAQGDYAWPEWSPDGRYIMVSGPSEIGQNSVSGLLPSVYILDVSTLVAQNPVSAP